MLLFAFLFCLCQLDVSWSRLGKGKAIGDLPPSDWLVASLWSFQNHDWYGRARPIVSGDILGQYLKKKDLGKGKSFGKNMENKNIFQKKARLTGQWWRTPSYSAPGRQGGLISGSCGPPDSRSEFQDSQGYPEEPYLEKENEKEKEKEKRTIAKSRLI